MNYLNAYSSSDDGSDQEDVPSWQIRQNELVIHDIINDILLKVEKNCRNYYKAHNHHHLYRNPKKLLESESESDLSPFSSTDIDSDDDIVDVKIDGNESDWDPNKPCITKGELTFEDLPKISKLNIYSPIEQLTQLGTVTSILEKLVVVKSFTNIPVLDLDSTLFLKSGTELGQVFDVIGSVKQPNYVIRFNSQQEIKELNINMNMPVYYNANFPQPYTKYVFINELTKVKGSDASWKDNNEPPPEALDYSDDEIERQEKWKREAKFRNRK